MLKRVFAITALLLGTASLGVSSDISDNEEERDIESGLTPTPEEVMETRAPSRYYLRSGPETPANANWSLEFVCNVREFTNKEWLASLTDKQRSSLEGLYGKLCGPDFEAYEASDAHFHDMGFLRLALQKIESTESVHRFYFPPALLKMLGSHSGKASWIFEQLLGLIPEGTKFTSRDRWYKVMMRLLETLPEAEQTYANLYEIRLTYLVRQTEHGNKKTSLRILREAIDKAEKEETPFTMSDVRVAFDSQPSALIVGKGLAHKVPGFASEVGGALASPFTEEGRHGIANIAEGVVTDPGGVAFLGVGLLFECAFGDERQLRKISEDKEELRQLREALAQGTVFVPRHYS